MDIIEHTPLGGLTTFRIGGPARYVIPVSSPEQAPLVCDFARTKSLPLFVLGGGSNVLIADHGFDGVVLKMDMRGIDVVAEHADRVLVRAAGGEDWDRFVAWCVERGYWGLENLSLIPGTSGAAPVQNIGAYGLEAADTIVNIEAFDRTTNRPVTLSRDDCRFGYRRSIFNTTHRERYVITSVTFELRRDGAPVLTHRALRERLTGRTPSLAAMREAVMALRSDGRLPDVKTTGNAGSFFKNVVLDAEQFEAMLVAIQNHFGVDEARRVEALGRRFLSPEGFKIPAVDLIRLCGLTGRRSGGAALYSANPLVIVNAEGRATAADVMCLAEEVQAVVREQTGVALEIEPVLLR